MISLPHQPVSRKRVSIIGMKVPARAHTEIFSEDGKELIGEVTSGGFSPTLGKPIAMGYGLQIRIILFFCRELHQSLYRDIVHIMHYQLFQSLFLLLNPVSIIIPIQLRHQ